MHLIDFDAYFADYLNHWVKNNERRFKHPDDMEDEMPGVYQQFLAAPAEWLEGIAPEHYFDRYEDSAELCQLLCAYASSSTPIPDLLLNRLAELEGETALLTLVQNEAAPVIARMHGIDLLRQLDSDTPMVTYIRWQVEREQEEDILNNALESLRTMGSRIQKPAKIAFLAAEQEGKEALLDVLCDFPMDEEVFAFALTCFQTQPQRQALFAGYLAKLEDDRALESLLDVAEDNKTPYVDFIEIRSAIERLGGEAPIRDFSKDPSYQAVQQIQ